MLELKENIMPESKEFDFLIKLLDDEDEIVYSNVRERFISHGKNTAEFLGRFLNDENILIKNRATEIITAINYENITGEIRKILNSGSDSVLEEVMFELASFGYPAFNKTLCRQFLDKTADEIKQRIYLLKEEKTEITSAEILEIFNGYLFKEAGFKGNTEDYYNPENSFINKVIESKTGIPVTLSIVYILIAKRLKLPVSGINLPGHFIIKYDNGRDQFFIDPYNGGVIISRKEAAEFINSIGMNDNEFENIPYLRTATDKEILLRVIRNLTEIYKKENNNIKAAQLEKLMLGFG